MHQPFYYEPDPMSPCEEVGCYFKKLYKFRSITNFCCVKCGYSVSYSEKCLDDVDWALYYLGINLYE